ncbi:hypothetical protein [Pseudoalteromonas sp.]|uniref:hypothetical protein n=1 Tax=Pseudoalteromonas sp. TaxID=53249 RepID=UPI00235595D5|nr:hypothetical protein [Pseudoalteromonas sp.]
MNKLTIMALTVATTLVLQGCGSNSKKVITPVAPVKTTTPTNPTSPAAVHLIQPEDVSKYVETFKQNQAELELQIEGVKFDISLVEIYTGDNIIAAKYKNGYLMIGFNFDKEEPVSSLTVLESDLPFEQAVANPARALDSTSIDIQEDSDNIIYSGTVTDRQTKGIFNVRLVFNESLVNGGSSTIEVTGTQATVNGDLGTNTYIQMSDLINNNPAVDTLILQQISGSVNDEINMHTGRLVRNAQLTTMVESDSAIYSGGVDLFASGAKRVYTEGAKVGVHSWCCVNGVTADKLGRDHAGHGAQLTYFREMLGAELGPKFYFFTIEAAPFDGAHEMTKAELDKYLLQP